MKTCLFAPSISLLLAFSAFVAGCGNGSSSAPTIPATSAPVVASIAPTAVPAGASATTLTVTGSGFTAQTTIEVGNASETATFVSSTQLTASVPAAQLATGGLLPVKALNGADASTAAINLEVDNPVPSVTQIAPQALAVGAPGGTVIVTGTGFVSTTSVYVNGSARPTTYGNATQVTAALSTADLAAAGSLQVSAVNPSPQGGASQNLVLSVVAPTSTPVIQSVQPEQFIAGTTGNYVNVFGTGLTPNSTVLWNGVALPNPVSSSYPPYPGTYLAAAVPDSLVASTGTASITVNTPSATPSLSNAVSVTITNPPAPTLTSLSPSSGPTATDTPITLNGTGFTASSTVSFNGNNLPATYTNGTLTVTLPAAAIALPGNGSFTVTTPAPGGGTTAPLTFTAYVGIPNNSMVYDPATGLFYVSVPSSAGAPYGNSVVSVDPATGALGTPILVGSEPDLLAITSDGHYLWVSLDGAAAVRQVDLTTSTAGLEFSFGNNSGYYDSPPTVTALSALPGAPNSVVVALQGGAGSATPSLGIYDSGVLRGTSATNNYYSEPYALQVDGTRSEIYAAGQGFYTTYTYNSSGITQLATNTSGNYANYSQNEIQVVGGRLYTDFGTVDDAESGSLLGTFYSSGTTVALGSTTVDTTLGRAFILDSVDQYSTPNQIQVFNIADFTSASSSTIPFSLSDNSSNTQPSRLTRWGTNGLAFRASIGVVSLRSNLVKDLSSVTSDLGVTLAASGATTTGSSTTYIATITNNGISAATNIALTALAPSTGVLISATPYAGTCAIGATITCDLAELPNSGTATVTFVVQQLTAGDAPLIVQVSGSETDPAPANNHAVTTPTITGAPYSPAPALSSLTPSAIEAGAPDTLITLTGSGFTSASSILLNGAALSTTLVSSTQLTATIPAANLASLGWSSVAVSTAAPGGGATTALPLTFYSVITLGVNHILYDPFSRNIMASVGSGSSTVTGNSIVAITPDTGAISSAVSIGSQPTNLALTDDGQILYTILSGSQSVARYNMLTQQADFTYAVPPDSSFDGGIALRGISAQPGTENTIALDIASFTGNAIYDFDPVNKTATIRGHASGPYSGSCIHFLDSGDLLAFDTDTSFATLDHYAVTSAGFTNQQYTTSTLLHFSCFQLSGGLVFAQAGGVANPATVPATQLGVFANVQGGGFFSPQVVAPDASLQQVFFTGQTADSNAINAITAYDPKTYLPTLTIPIDLPTIEGNTNYTPVDLIRWGQDGLALLSSGGHIYLLRGAAVVPQLLNQNAAATLSSSSITTISHGAGNTLLTLTGSHFVPGVAAEWDGAYRTTTIVDATHATVAIPASDLTTAGTHSLVLTNPGAPASAALTITIN